MSRINLSVISKSLLLTVQKVSSVEWLVLSKSKRAILSGLVGWTVTATTDTPNSNNFVCNCPAINGGYLGRSWESLYPCKHIVAVCVHESIEFMPVVLRSLSDTIDSIVVANLNTLIDLKENVITASAGAIVSGLQSKFLDNSVYIPNGGLISISAGNLDFTSDDFTVEYFQWLNKTSASNFTFRLNGIVSAIASTTNEWIYTKYVRNGNRFTMSLGDKVVGEVITATPGKVLIVSADATPIIRININPDNNTMIQILGLANSFILGTYYSELRISSYAKETNTIIKSTLLG